MFQVSLVRMATRKHLVPLAVESPASWSSRPSREFFGCSVKKADRQRIVFSAADSVVPFLSGNEVLAQFYEGDLQGELEKLSQERTTGARLQTVLVQMLPSGTSAIEDAAARLAMSARTLQRHLAHENTTFLEQLTAARESLAKHYLSRSRLTGAEISYLLAYDDPNSFPRAFHHWTGQSPESYRRQSLRYLKLPPEPAD